MYSSKTVRKSMGKISQQDTWSTLSTDIAKLPGPHKATDMIGTIARNFGGFTEAELCLSRGSQHLLKVTDELFTDGGGIDARLKASHLVTSSRPLVDNIT
jgi:hypothetical protein